MRAPLVVILVVRVVVSLLLSLLLPILPTATRRLGQAPLWGTSRSSEAPGHGAPRRTSAYAVRAKRAPKRRGRRPRSK